MLLKTVCSISSCAGKRSSPSMGLVRLSSSTQRRGFFSLNCRSSSIGSFRSIRPDRTRSTNCFQIKSRAEFLRENFLRNFGTETVEPGNAGSAPKKADETSKDQPETIIPTPAKWLGYGGLIPFVSGALGSLYFVSLGPMGLPNAAYVVFLQMTYGATILSFLGAVHWGLAMANYKARPDVQLTPQTNNWRYALSVVPSLIAWAGLAVNPTYAMISLLLSFTGTHIAEMAAHSKGLTPPWYMKLRTPLTIFTILSLGISFVEAL